MPNANWSNPTLTSTYTNFVSEVKNRDEDLALQFDGTTSTNIPTNTIRWDSGANRWKKWNGSTWVELTSTYALTGLSTSGNATVGGTLGVTGAATFSGGGTSTTPAVDNNTGAIATTAFVAGQASTASPLVNGTATAGTSLRYSRQDHVHPTDTTRAPLASPTFSGTVTIPAGASISGYAQLASPAFTGTPVAPTAAAGTSTTQIATTAFAMSAMSRLPDGTVSAPSLAFANNIDLGLFSTAAAPGISIALDGFEAFRFTRGSSLDSSGFEVRGQNYNPYADITLSNTMTAGSTQSGMGIYFLSQQAGGLVSNTPWLGEFVTQCTSRRSGNPLITTGTWGYDVKDMTANAEKGGYYNYVIAGNGLSYDVLSVQWNATEGHFHTAGISGTTFNARAYFCRAWVNFNGTGTVAIRAKGNVTSISDNGVGDYTVNFTAAMPDGGYAAIANYTKTNSATGQENDGQAICWSHGTSSVRVFVCDGAAVPRDPIFCSVSIFR